MSRSLRTAVPTSGVTCCAAFTCVWSATSTSRSRARVAIASYAASTSSCRKCCGMPIRPLVAIRMSRMFSMSISLKSQLLQALGRHVGHVAAADDHVAHLRGLAQVVEHRVPAVVLLHLELVLEDLQGVVADEVHPRAVTAVLRARRDQLGEHLRRVAVRQALDRPHVGLVQRVAARQRVARPLRLALGVGGRHVPPHGVGVQVGLDHRVDHLRRDQHRHRRALLLVALDVRVQLVGQEVTERRLELLEVLDRVGALPLGGLPLAPW